MSKIFNFLKEVRSEMLKVVWPSRKEALRMTLIIIVFSVIISFFLGAIDLGLTKLVQIAFNR